MKIKKFKDKPELKPCSNCGQKEKELSSIRIHTSNVNHRYQTSQRPWMNNYSMRLCGKCFKSFEKQLINIEI